MSAKTIPFEEVKERLLRDPETRQAYEDLEPAYQIARLRIMRGLTQQELADLVGTKQPSIARLESGNSTPSLSFLNRLAEALGASLTVKIEVEDTDTLSEGGP
jgi:transcriptional regulator with XRE-family HTH domain